MPILESFTAKWDKYTSGLSDEEVADLEEARTKLENYKKIYEIYEYATELNSMMYVIETQISSNNPTYPMNIYRKSASTTLGSMFGDIENVMQAYYDLIDDCEGYPEWQRKVVLDLGGTVSYLALTIDDSSRDALIECSDVF